MQLDPGAVAQIARTMQLDPGAVAQIARTYHGYYKVDSGKGGGGQVLRYDNDFQEDGGSSLEINCEKGIIVIKLRTPHRGKTEVEKDGVDYKTLHQVFKDPRCFFLPAIVKPKRRSSRELSGEDKLNEGPLVFTLSAYKDPARQMPVVPRVPINGIIGPGLMQGGIQDLGAPLSGGLGLRVPTDSKSIGPRVPCGAGPPQVAQHTAAKNRKIEQQAFMKTVEVNDGNKSMENNLPQSMVKVIGPARPDPALLPPESVDQHLQTVDQLYRTKTRTELNYLKRKQELDRDRLKKRAELSHKDKIEGYNSYLGSLPEFNEQRKINWSKH